MHVIALFIALFIAVIVAQSAFPPGEKAALLAPYRYTPMFSRKREGAHRHDGNTSSHGADGPPGRSRRPVALPRRAFREPGNGRLVTPTRHALDLRGCAVSPGVLRPRYRGLSDRARGGPAHC